MKTSTLHLKCESSAYAVRGHIVPLASSPPSAKAESLPLADFYSAQQPHNLTASVMEFYSDVDKQDLIRMDTLNNLANISSDLPKK